MTTTPSPSASERAERVIDQEDRWLLGSYDLWVDRDVLRDAITTEITAAEQAAEARGAANAINDIAAVLDANDVEAFTALIMKAKASPDLEPVGRSALKSEAEIAAEAELRGAERMRERCVAAAQELGHNYYRRRQLREHDGRPVTRSLIAMQDAADSIATALAALPLEEGKG